MKTYIVFVIGNLWAIFSIWAHGGSFEQGAGLGAMAISAPVIGILAVILLKILETSK